MRIKESIFFICVVLYCCSLSNKELKAQSSVSVGFGIPEFINAGYRFHNEQKGIGINIGTMFSSDDVAHTARASVYYHFYGKRKYSLIKPWYLNSGFTFYREDDNLQLDQRLLIDLRLGREFSLNHFWGIFSEIGIAGVIWEETFNKLYHTTRNIGNNIYPSCGLGIYYRFSEGCNCPKQRKH